MSLADVTSRLAGDLAELRRQQAALGRELEQAKAELAARDRAIGLLVEQLGTTGQALEAAARRAAMAEHAHARAETGLAVARAEAAILRTERDAARQAAWALNGQMGVLEAALTAGWLRRIPARHAPGRPDGALVLTVALGLNRAELSPVIQMVRAEAARTPLLLVVDQDLDERLDPTPAEWLRLPALRELPRRVAVDRRAYLRRRLAMLIRTLQPATVVPLGSFAAQLLGRDDAPS